MSKNTNLSRHAPEKQEKSRIFAHDYQQGHLQ